MCAGILAQPQNTIQYWPVGDHRHVLTIGRLLNPGADVLGRTTIWETYGRERDREGLWNSHAVLVERPAATSVSENCCVLSRACTEATNSPVRRERFRLARYWRQHQTIAWSPPACSASVNATTPTLVRFIPRGRRCVRKLKTWRRLRRSRISLVKCQNPLVSGLPQEPGTARHGADCSRLPHSSFTQTSVTHAPGLCEPSHIIP